MTLEKINFLFLLDGVLCNLGNIHDVQFLLSMVLRIKAKDGEEVGRGDSQKWLL